MFPSFLLKSINWTLAISMLVQPVLAAIPPEIVRAAPAETAPQAAPEVAAVATELLTATVPAPLLVGDATTSAPAFQQASEVTSQPNTTSDPLNMWTWVGGRNRAHWPGVYGTKGVASSANMPGARSRHTSWTDASGTLWLFGGIGYSASNRGYLSDLWKYDGSNWTWVSGSSEDDQPGVYGTQGVPASDNMPGARYRSRLWVDTAGNLWLFGGYGYDSTGTEGFLNDLWKYDRVTGMWTWVGGANVRNQSGIYGTKGVPASGNMPGARSWSISWVDTAGYLWLFGGDGYDSTGARGSLNDLWKYNGSTWTWVSGSNVRNRPGIYGTKGVPAAGNMPGARGSSVSWVDTAGNLWLFGGYGYSYSAYYSANRLNDLWKYDCMTGMWTWVSGSNSHNQISIYGTQGVPAAGNMPGARYMSTSWTDNAGNFWLFGGAGSLYEGVKNDLWKYDCTTGMWTWVGGSKTDYESGIYGTQGVPAAGNMPGARYESISWTDSAGNFWLFGGWGYDSFGLRNVMDDTWKYDGITGMWTWVGGSKIVNFPGVYGFRGVSNPDNMPGGRHGSVSWTDAQDNLWLFGGCGNDSAGAHDYLNDLWKYDGSAWIWVGGSDLIGQRGIYGTKGVANPANMPGARRDSVSWTDKAGNLWLFGGYGHDSTGMQGSLNDLWKYDPMTGMWTWVSGSNLVNQWGTYGTQGLTNPANMPGARYDSISWTDLVGNLWLFGGYGYDGAGDNWWLNDLWKYDGMTGMWTWVSGSDLGGQQGVYGSKGMRASTNVPGSRYGGVSWIDTAGNLWLFGGYGYGVEDWGELNDLWKYDGSAWTWVSGSDIVEQDGVYGEKGIANPANTPGSRRQSVSWTDGKGNLWLFGGFVSGYYQLGYMNDLWKYDGNAWAWVSGSSTEDELGVCDTRGVPDPANVPGARLESISWVDKSGNLWLFGGAGADCAEDWGTLNDLWKYKATQPPAVFIGTTRRTGGGTDWPVDNYAKQTQAYVGNPINTANGNQTYETTDLRLPTPSGEIYFSRSYSSFNAYYDSFESEISGFQYQAGSLGPGWMHNYETRLKFPFGDDLSRIGLLTPGATYVIFEQDDTDPNRYTAQSEGIGGEIVRGEVEGHFVYTSPEGIEMVFYDNIYSDAREESLVGRLDYINFQLDGIIDLEYAEDEPYRLERVADSTAPDTRYMTFAYGTYEEDGGDGLAIRLESVSLPPADGRSISFAHTDFHQDENVSLVPYWNTNLISFTDVRGQHWDYLYADSTTHSDPARPELTLDYEAYPSLRHFLVERRMPPMPGQSQGSPIIRYWYQMNPEAGLMHVSPARAVSEVDGAGQPTVNITYSDDGDPTTIHYGAGDIGPILEHTYDSDFRLTQVSTIDQDGALLDGLGWHTSYLSHSYRPTATIDPNTNVTHYTWTDNDMAQETVTYAELSSESFTFYQFVSQAAGLHLPEFIFYPFRGSTPERIQTRLIYNTSTLADPNQTYRPDMIGEPDRIDNTDYPFYPDLSKQLLLARIDDPEGPNGGFETLYHYYDAGPRKGLVQCVNSPIPGGDTYYDYDEDSRQPILVDQGCTCTSSGGYIEGHPTQITYDDLHRVSTTTGPDGMVTLYQYVDDSDLVMVATEHYSDSKGFLAEDANGDTWNIKTAYFYDVAGRLIGTVENYDPDYRGGMDASYDFDGDGVDEVFYVNSAAPHINQATLYTYGMAGRVVEVTANLHSGMGAYQGGYNFSTRTVYDGAGRVAAVIENYIPGDVGGVPARLLDLDGDGVAETALAVSPDAPDRNRVTLNRYNSLGRLKQVISPAWANASGAFVPYDTVSNAGGQTLTYNRITAYEYDDAGNVTKTIVNYKDNEGAPGGLPLDVDLGPGDTTTLKVFPWEPDYNIATCVEYDVLNRPVFTRTACVNRTGVDGVPDYHVVDGSVYNQVSYTAYDALNRPIVVVNNYDGPADPPMSGDITLTPTTEHNFITRIYYDGLGRTEWVVQNMTGSTGRDIEEVLLTATADGPDHNLITRTYYNEAGQHIAVVENYRSADVTLQASEIIDGLDEGYNHVTRTFYRADGLPSAVVGNFVFDAGDDDAILAASGPPAFNSLQPDRNLTTYYQDYDDLNRPVKVSINRWDDHITNLVRYDNLGRVDWSIFDYDNQPRITHVDYAKLGFDVLTTDPAGRMALTTADARGNASTVIDPDIAANPNPDPLHLTVANTFDLLGRVTSSDDGENAPVLTTYDALGQAITVTSSDRVITTTYNLLGQAEVVKEEGAGNACSATRYQYDNLGRLLRVVENFTTIPGVLEGCDPAGVQEPKDVETEYRYDAMGNLTGVMLANGSAKEYEYDALGQVTFEVLDPAGQKLFNQYCYDAAGSVVLTVRGKGETSAVSNWCTDAPPTPDEPPDSIPEEYLATVYRYDALGRPVLINYEDTGDPLTSAHDVTLAYDSFGNRETMTETGGRAWTYTSTRAGLLESVNWTQGGTPGTPVSYEYDAAGNRTRLTAGTLLDTRYVLDDAGRLESVDTDQDGSGDVVYTYDDPTSRVKTVSLPNGMVSTYTYDQLGRLDIMSHGVGSIVASSFDYDLDGLGNRTGATEFLRSSVPAASWASLSIAEPVEVLSAQAETGLSMQGIPEPPDPTPDLEIEEPQVEEIPTEGVHLVIDQLSDTLDLAWEASDICKRSLYISLSRKIEDTRKALEQDDDDLAIRRLNALLDAIEKQAGKCLAQDMADQLIVQVQRLVAQLNEPSIPPVEETPEIDELPELPEPLDPPDMPEIPEPALPDDMAELDEFTASSDLTVLQTAALASALVVNSTGDGADSNVGDGLCDDGTGACTLRAAIQETNAAAGLDTITFNIPGTGPYTIQPTSALPTISDPVVIDATTQPGYVGAPIVELDGTNAGSGIIHGLRITSADSTVRGLVINRFAASGILLSGAGATGNVIEGNYIGTDVTGTVALENGNHGIRIVDGANNIIGGTAPAAGNVISGNHTQGIAISGSAASGTIIQGNIIGADVTGTLDLGNGASGVYLLGGATNTIVGGTATGAGNIISGNDLIGVYIEGIGTSGNTVQGNLIGTDAGGTHSLSNTQYGVGIVNGASNNTIGGIDGGTRNVISSNGWGGIVLNGYSGTVSGNLVQGNLIGTDVTGTADLGNMTYGVIITGDAANNAIGGSTGGSGNVISGNDLHGVIISGSSATANLVQGNTVGADVTGIASLGNGSHGVYVNSAPNNTIGGTESGAGNLISGNGAAHPTDDGSAGIYITGGGASGNLVQGNHIGTDASGTAALTNSQHGVVIANGASSNTVGGTVPEAGNLISGNRWSGVVLNGYSGTVSDNVVQGNLIGTDITGTADLGNTAYGVYLVNSAVDNTIGGTASEAGNIISGNDSSGVTIISSNASGNQVQGNTIGADVTGTASLGNGVHGVYINSAPNNTIGGTEPGAGNLISGNGEAHPADSNCAGVIIVGSGANDNLVQGNLIGANAGGTASLTNSQHGVVVANGASSNTIGGTAPGAGNLISGNRWNGIVFNGYSGVTTGNLVQGNLIGTDTTGMAGLGNGVHGIYIVNSATHTTIGGSDPQAGNTIAFNNTLGVYVVTDSATGHAIRGNRIFSNGWLGIDLTPGGVTPNDSGDGDSGPNNFQNYPVLSAAASNTSSTTVDGTLNSTADTTFTLDFYASQTCDPSGYGEGATYLGAGEVTTDAGGDASFSITVPTAAADGWAITATTTDPDGNTSEFSACVVVVGTGTPPQSTDPIFDAINLPHDPALGPTWDGEHLTAEQFDAYRAEFTVDGVIFVGLDGEEPLSASAAFVLDALRQDGTQTDLPAPDPMTGNPEAVNGWLVQDNILLRERQTDLYEVIAAQAEGIEQAYLLAAPVSASTGDLELVVGLDTTLVVYPAEEGVYLLDEDSNGIFVGPAMAIDANGDSIAVAVQSSIVNQQSAISLVIPGDWLSTAAYPVLVDPLWVGQVGFYETNYGWHYQYDGLSRLVGACSDGEVGETTCNGDLFTYEYDLVGNLERLDRWNGSTKQVDTVRFDIDPSTNRVEAMCVDGDGGTPCTPNVTYTYDAYGNLTSDGPNTYTYDTALRLVRVVGVGGTTEYEYNGDGDRVAETVGGVRTDFTLDVAAGLTQVLVEETESRPDDPIIYLYGLGLIGESMNGVTEYHLTDGLGSVRQLTNAGGKVLLAQTFDPYGNRYERARGEVLWDAASPFGWTGEQSDPNGLTYLRARYYAPSMGRFTQIDPFAGALTIPASMNGYGYAHGAPTMYTDPSGEFICAGLCLAAAVLIIAGGIAFSADYTSQTIDNMNRGMDFWQAAYYQNHNWKRTAFRTGEAIVMASIGLGFGLAIGAAGFTGAAAWMLGGIADVAVGAAWDIGVYKDPFSDALVSNMFSFGIGEIAGYGIGRAAKGLGKGIDTDVDPQMVFRRGKLGKAESTSIKAEIRNAQSAIRSVHSINDLADIPVRGYSAPGDLTIRAGGYRRSPPGIGINTRGTNQGAALVHEFGHYVDHYGFGVRNGAGELIFGSDAFETGLMTNPEMSNAYRTLFERIRISGTYQTIIERRTRALQFGYDDVVEHADYLLRNRELFARSYTQYIATRSENAALLAQVDNIAYAYNMRTHWAASDFVGIAEAYDALFRIRGWRP